MEKDVDYLCQAVSSGVEGYLLEEEGIVELFSAIHTIRQGGFYVSPRFSLILSDDFLNRCRLSPNSLFMMTSREKEVLRLIAEGKSNSEIASLLFISVRTVEHHRAKIMNKLSLRRITDLIKYAIRNGYATP
jgi:DNA-binding NarL/FixJ family response regulator